MDIPRNRQIHSALAVLIRSGIPALLACLALALGGCPQRDAEEQVVVYASVDQHHAEPILEAFEAQSGVKVNAVYDVEAAKTTGLVNRLIAERKRPQADVFWSGEFAQTIRLEKEGIFERYEPSTAAGLPRDLSDPFYDWTGFGGRARVFLVNTDLVEEGDYPTRMEDFLDERWPASKIAIALPLFGTTKTHACALYVAWGPARAREFFQQLKDRGVRVEQGNSTVRDLVADGTLMWGLTDTDDAAGALSRGAPVAAVFPDQGPEGIGTLVTPNTVGLVYAAKHPEQARQLIDYLVSAEVERRMVETGWCHVPLRELGIEPQFIDGSGVRRMDVHVVEVEAELEAVEQDLAEIFIN